MITPGFCTLYVPEHHVAGPMLPLAAVWPCEPSEEAAGSVRGDTVRAASLANLH